jgi:hypothetical protein
MSYFMDQRKRGMSDQPLRDANREGIYPQAGVKKDLQDYPALVKDDDKKMRGKINAVDKKDYERFKKDVSDPIERMSY